MCLVCMEGKYKSKLNSKDNLLMVKNANMCLIMRELFKREVVADVVIRVKGGTI